MPLVKGKSERAFSHNVGAEISAGKPKSQALAIAFSVRRKAQHKAGGGEVEDHGSMYAHHISEAIRHKRAMAMGGAVEDESEDAAEEREEFLSPDLEAAEEEDPKEKMRSRIREILSR